MKIKFSLEEKSGFFTNLGKLLQSGVSIDEALAFVAKRYDSKKREVISGVLKSVQGGKDFSLSIFQAKIADKFLSDIFKSAEMSGRLSEELLSAGAFLSKEDKFVKELKKNLFYPIFILSMGSLLFAFILFYLIPSYVSMFSQNGIPLPLVTKILIKASTMWPLFLIFGIVFSGIFFKFISHPTKKLAIPIIGEIFKHKILKGVSFSIGHQLGAGIPLLTAINSIDDHFLLPKISKISKKITNGEMASSAFASDPFFTKEFLLYLELGEKGGELSSSFLSLGDYFAEKVDEGLKKVVKFVEPVSTIMVGLFVGFAAIGVLLPIFSMTSSLLK